MTRARVRWQNLARSEEWSPSVNDDNDKVLVPPQMVKAEDGPRSGEEDE